jgi:hypothetical protein
MPITATAQREGAAARGLEQRRRVIVDVIKKMIMT